MYDNIDIFFDDAEIHITEFTARKAIRLLKKKIAECDFKASDGISSARKKARCYAFLAEAYMIDKKINKALKNALRAKRIDPEYYYVNVILIQIYCEDGRFLKAEKYLIDMFEKAPEGYYFLYYAAVLLYGQMNKEKLCKIYAKKLIDLNLTTPDYILLKSFCYLQLKNYGKALKELMRVIFKTCRKHSLNSMLIIFFSSINSLIVEKLNMDVTVLSLLNLYLGRFLKSVSEDEFYYVLSEMFYDDLYYSLICINEAIRINPKPICYHIRKASILNLVGHVDKAIEIYKNILKKDDSYIECFGNLCIAYQMKGDFRAALKYANLALLNSSENENAYLNKVSVLRKLRKNSQALEVLKKLEDISPENEILYYVYSQIYADMEDFNKALLYINKQLMKEKDVHNYCSKMIYLFRLDRYEEALNCGREALKYEPHSTVYYWMATCYIVLEQFEEALDCINKAIFYGEYDMWTFAQKSRILDALGRSHEAEFAYKKAVELGYEE